LLSTSLRALYCVNVALPVEEEMCCKFLNKNHKNFGKDIVVLHDGVGTMDSLHSTTTTHTPLLASGLFTCGKDTYTST
jgi:hypothetical protein